MVSYNPKDWFSLIFRFHKSDTFRVLLPVMIGIAFYCGVVVFVHQAYFPGQFQGTTVVHSLLGFVISMLLVFRTNTAYERWWEGRKLWGALVNNSRNLAIKLNAILRDEQSKKDWAALIANYALVTKEHLRGASVADELIPCRLLNRNSVGTGEIHAPNAMAKIMYLDLSERQKAGEISEVQFRNLNLEFQSFTDITGACERIKRTPIPFSYSLFIKKFIFIYVMSMPFGFSGTFSYWTIPVVVLTFYVLASLELIAEEIEDPFGRDANDLPTDEISANIAKHVKEILG